MITRGDCPEEAAAKAAQRDDARYRTSCGRRHSGRFCVSIEQGTSLWSGYVMTDCP